MRYLVILRYLCTCAVLEDRQNLIQLSIPRQIVVAANWTAVAVSGPIDPATKVEYRHFIRDQDAIQCLFLGD
jgi:hypothetical protein